MGIADEGFRVTHPIMTATGLKEITEGESRAASCTHQRSHP